GLAEIVNGATVSSSTWAKGDAGDVIVHAGQIKIDDQRCIYQTGIMSDAIAETLGDAGTVEVTVDGLLEIINAGQISSNTKGQGDAGNVVIHARDLRINNNGIYNTNSGISSQAESDSQGDAGAVAVKVTERIELINGGRISSNTNAQGHAGQVIVQTNGLFIDGADSIISSAASHEATGYVGNVLIETGSANLKNGGSISIIAEQVLSQDRLATMPQNAITIQADSLHIDQEARITAQSSGNAPAGAINIRAGKTLVENSGRITTSSREADGGPITIQGDSLFLKDGLISTS
ncbi:MAG: hypothetical protein GY809_27800, partial [Planctomycetes bacterium]|nr:hypothetical protein [Planctomycetota bacterium]